MQDQLPARDAFNQHSDEHAAVSYYSTLLQLITALYLQNQESLLEPKGKGRELRGSNGATQAWL
jgi:hypothetical protein